MNGKRGLIAAHRQNLVIIQPGGLEKLAYQA